MELKKLFFTLLFCENFLISNNFKKEKIPVEKKG